MKIIFLSIFLIFCLFSCRQVIQNEFAEFEPVPVINAILIAGEPVKVHVSMAEKLDTNQLGFVDNATVDLYVNGVFTESLVYADSGVYLSSAIVEVQKEYTSKVEIPGYEIVECSQFIPNKPVLKKIEHINIAGKDEEGTTFPALKILFNNEVQTNTFYEVDIRIIQRWKDTFLIRPAELEAIIDPVILNEGLPIPLFSNGLINDSIYTLNINYTTGGAKSINGTWYTVLRPLVVELRQVSEEYYRYKKQLYLYEEGLLADGLITSMTNANLYSNVTNGYGAFVAYSYTVSDTITPNTDGYYD